MTFFQKPTPAVQQENQLLRLWSQRRSLDTLSSLPIQLLLQSQLRKLDKGTSSISPSTLQRVKRSVANLSAFVSRRLVQWPLAWLSRRRCLQPLRVLLVNTRRRATLFLLVRAVRLARSALRSRGRRS